MKAAEPIAQQGLWDSFWEQQTHWQSAFLLKISGSSYLVVNLDKMNTIYCADAFTTISLGFISCSAKILPSC